MRKKGVEMSVSSSTIFSEFIEHLCELRVHLNLHSYFQLQFFLVFRYTKKSLIYRSCTIELENEQFSLSITC